MARDDTLALHARIDTAQTVLMWHTWKYMYLYFSHMSEMAHSDISHGRWDEHRRRVRQEMCRWCQTISGAASFNFHAMSRWVASALRVKWRSRPTTPQHAAAHSLCIFKNFHFIQPLQMNICVSEREIFHPGKTLNSFQQAAEQLSIFPHRVLFAQLAKKLCSTRSKSALVVVFCANVLNC